MDTRPTTKSAELYAKALKLMPGGVSRNTVLRKPHPIYADFAKGARVTDIEGVERIDFANNMAALIHGHADPEIVAAVHAQMARGSAFTLATEVEVQYAEHLVSRSESFEKCRFVNSGTEAVMGCLKAARAFTGRAKIAKVEGAYHGLYDYAEVSQTAKPDTWGSVDHPSSTAVSYGTPASALADVVVIPFNDVEHALAILNEHKGELACVLIDLMPHRVGLRPAEADFVQALRDWTQKDGALMVVDEVITYRSTYGGAQEWYGLKPDLTAMGKMIGGGFPVGALAGRAEVMDVMNPLAEKVLFPHSGTFSANPITMTAGLSAMRRFDRPAIERINGLAARAMRGIEAAIQRTGIEACVTGGGSMFRVHMKAKPPMNYREAYPSPQESARIAKLIDHAFDHGIILVNTCTAILSTVMGEEEIDTLVSVLESGFELIQNGA